MMRSTSAVILLWVLSVVPTFAYSANANLPYSGRFVKDDGRPVDGPVDITIEFFRNESDNKPISPSHLFTDVNLSAGVFQINLSLDTADFQTIFLGSSINTWIQVTDSTNGVVYPRQLLAATPYALKVPVDNKTLMFNDNGELEVKNEALSTSKLGGQTVVTSGASQGEVLAWDNSSNQWQPTSTPKVDASQIQAGAVQTAGLADSSVTEVKLASSSVTASKIASGTIGPTHLDPAVCGANEVWRVNSDQTGFTCDPISTPSNVLFNGGNSGSVVVGSTDNDLTLKANGTNFVTLNAAGQLGIGSDTPQARLHVQGSTNQVQALVRGSTLQTSDIQQWQSHDGKLRLGVTANGSVAFSDNDGSSNRVTLKGPNNLAADATYTLPPNPQNGQFLSTDGVGTMSWAIPSETGDIESVVAGTGLTGGATTGDATLAVDTGTTANKIVQLDGTGKLPAVDGSQLTNLAIPSETGDIESVVAGMGLIGGATTGDATLNVDVGTTANKIVQLDGAGKLPAVDGSQLTNLTIPSETGDIESVVAGTGLTGGATTGNATLNVDVGTSANKIVQLDGTGKLPAVDGSRLTGISSGDQVLGQYQNLRIKPDAGSPADTVNISVGKVVLNNTGDQSVMHKNVMVNATLNSSGINGLDTGTEANNTWYYIWLISNGTTVASTLSISPASTLLPSGYDYFLLIGAIFNNATSDIRSFFQSGKSVKTQYELVGSYSSTLLTEVDLTAYVPPIAPITNITYRCTWAVSGYTSNCYAYADSTQTLKTTQGLTSWDSNYVYDDQRNLSQPMVTPSKMWTRMSSNKGKAYIYIQGFQMP